MTNIIKILVLFCCVISMSAQVSARTKFEERPLKASFIVNFISFTRWPLAPPKNNFLLCIAGNDPYSKIFDQYPDINIRGKSLEVKRLAGKIESSEIKRCHVLVILYDSDKKIASILDRVSELPILTISEISDYENQQSMINMVKREKQIVFSVNRNLSNKVNIEFSSKMLRLAESVTGGGK